MLSAPTTYTGLYMEDRRSMPEIQFLKVNASNKFVFPVTESPLKFPGPKYYSLATAAVSETGKTMVWTAGGKHGFYFRSYVVFRI